MISERKAAVRRYRSRVANWWRKVSRKPTPVDSVTALAAAAGGSLFRAPLAIAVPAMAFAIVCGWVVYRAGKYVESRALDRDWSSPRVRAAESLIVAACSVAYVAVFVLALRFEYGR